MIVAHNIQTSTKHKETSTTMDTTSSSPAPQVLAQLLNKRGAYCIETGRYDKAISNLVKAMEVSKQESNALCTCKDCTLESCIEYSHSLVQENKNESEDLTCSFLQHFSNREEEDEGYLYRIPILTKPEASGHSMGDVLPQIITFNLALAHQLKAIEENEDQYHIVVKLYQLIYQTQMKQKSRASFFFALVAANNLADIHHRLQNNQKQERCLKFVLSAVMLLGYESSSHSKGYCKVELEGFIRNTTVLILAPTCAPVA
jgi:tetratricopeptide (TPR) repeat protein